MFNLPDPVKLMQAFTIIGVVAGAALCYAAHTVWPYLPSIRLVWE